MLKLKKEIKEKGEDVIIFVSKHLGRKLRFPIDTDQEDYPKFKQLGFNIFRCEDCLKDNCNGDCIGGEINSDHKKSQISTKKDVSLKTEDSSIVNDDINKLNSEDLSSTTTEPDSLEDKVDEITDDNLTEEYRSLQLKDLRELFPDIKATSKQKFIEQINGKK